MDFYAKYDKENKEKKYQTLREHTDEVINEYKNFKKIYKKDIDRIIEDVIDVEEFWELLEICCEYHDYGKANVKFQNKLRKLMDMELLEDNMDFQEVPHGYLSPAFFLSKNIDKNLAKIIIQSIAYHHERNDMPDDDNIKEIFKNDLIPKLNEINKHMGNNIEKLNQKYLNSIAAINRINDSEDIESDKHKNYAIYVMIKGLLHRMDHSASAGCVVERQPDISINEVTKKYLSKWGLREVQKFADENKNKSMVIVASTGIGKTETALLWFGKNKGFFTLPLRVSINALFDRIENEIGYKNVGLLHSSAMDYLDEQGYENYYEIYENSKLLSEKITFSTIDQIFKFPFKYRGYEKVLATMAYSKIVIDEVQAYSPHIVAVIIKGIEMINRLGGKFLIMTATLPRIYVDELNRRGIIKNVEYKCYPSKIKRHKIHIIDETIESSINDIEEKAKNSKVLVIVNTVKKAVKLYKRIGEDVKKKLLHSMFTAEDRSILEEEIKDFTDREKNNENGVWVTTQIVEASLDVDFDYLFTEMSTLDSQFQRFGRCYRKRLFDKNEPNIYIYTKDISGDGTIYDKEILDKSIDLLKEWDNKIIEEEIKMKLVDTLYSKESLKKTKFYEEFNKTMKLLDNFTSYEITTPQAQKALRNINSRRIIPKSLYDRNLDLFLELEDCDKSDKFKIIRKINKLCVNVQEYSLGDKQNRLSLIEGFKDLYLGSFSYNKDIGLLLDKDSFNGI